MDYVLRLHGYNGKIVLELTMNYRDEHSTLVGAHIEVIEEKLVEVTGLPRTGEWWYTRRTSQPRFLRKFLETGESLVNKGTCFEHQSRPHPWDNVVVFLQQ